jgi:hypothetical protein
MTQMLFFRGHGQTPQNAVGMALYECANILMDNPSLVVQLESLTPMGHEWDADVRVMALKMVSDSKGVHKKGEPELNYTMKNPEHMKSGNPNEWRPIGMKHDAPPAAFRFDNAAHAGEVPDIPLQDFEVPAYELAGASEPELKRIMQELQERRLRVLDDAKLKFENE